MLPIKKVYIDTKFKTKDSKSNSNFKYELPNTMLMPENTVFYVNDVCIPHSWHTVESFNNKLYFRVSGVDENFDHILHLTEQVYNGATLAAELQDKINNEGYTATVSYNASKQQISVSIQTFGYQFLTDNELISPSLSPAWNGASYDKNNLNSANGLIKNNGNSSIIHSSLNNPLISYIDLQPIRNVYISSPNLGNFNTIGPNGKSGILKKVPVTADFNQMIIDQLMTTNDFLDCSKQTLRTIEFSLTDVNGNEIPLHGSEVSFSIIFDQMNTNT